MNSFLERSLEILERSPGVVSALLIGLSDGWTMRNEGAGTWTAKEVVAHLIVCEETNWLPRIRVLMSDEGEKKLAPIDMSAHFETARHTPLAELLRRFARLRESGMEELKALRLQKEDLLRTADHPVLGPVDLQQLIATWTTHDLAHIAQIARIMARQQTALVGGFKQYLSILDD